MSAADQVFNVLLAVYFVGIAAVVYSSRKRFKKDD